MSKPHQLRAQELIDNPSPRVPICLALDVSGSMAGSKILELNRAVAMFVSKVKEDEIASSSAELAIITFGGEVRCVLDFHTIDQVRAPSFVADGGTPLGHAVEQALDLLDAAKRTYSQLGVDYYQPWLVVITDGKPTDNVSRAVQRCQQMVLSRKLTVFPIGVGTDADMSTLSSLSPKCEPIRLTEHGLPVFFEWLSKSTVRVSDTNPGDAVSENLGVESWRKDSVSWRESFGLKP